MVTQADQKPETLLAVEPFYRKALELRAGGSQAPASMALSLELEAMALRDSADTERVHLLQDQARELRLASVKAMQAHPAIPSVSAVVDPGPVYRIGGGVSTPTVSFKADPEYTQEARLLKYSGTVVMSVIIDASGHPRSISVAKGLGFGLDEKAVEAVQKWVFQPAMKAGSPVNVRANIEVNFRLL
jgi:TonB family protein